VFIGYTLKKSEAWTLVLVYKRKTTMISNRKMKRKTGPKRRARARNVNGMKYTSGSTTIIRNPVADSLFVKLFYNDTTLLRNNVGGTVCSWRYRMNSAYDPDPALGTGAITGFNEYAALYDRYRVTKCSIDIEIANLESFAIEIIFAPTLLDVGTNYTGVSSMPEYPYGKKKILSIAGGKDSGRMKFTSTIARIEGSKSAYTDLLFSAVVNTNPTNTRWYNVGYITGGNVLVKGVFAVVRLAYEVQFTERLNINASPRPFAPIASLPEKYFMNRLNQVHVSK
jgi:hypothetical protein